MIYIIITSNIKTAGGTQCYTAAKAECLKKMGWKVIILSPSFHSKYYTCPINTLNEYLDGNFESLAISPFKLPSYIVKRTLNRIVRYVHSKNDKDVIIESHEDKFSQWGELLAARLNARHYFYLMNEFFRKPYQTYVDKMDFYSYKFNRGEILGGMTTFTRLFEGYKTISTNDFPEEVIIDECPVQDIYNEQIEAITHDDWNICYIGRGNKSYVPNIIKGVGEFAKQYKQNKIQFIVVGDIQIHKRIIDDIITENKNLSIIELGMLHPIPQSLFSKVDVVIAGSGSARHSAEEGVLTIIADTESCMANGLLGYETMNSIYKDKDSVVTTFFEAIERVLVKKVYQNKINMMPAKREFKDSILQNFSLFDKSSKNIEYYNEKKLLSGSIDIKQIARSFISLYCQKSVIFFKKLLYRIING